MPPGRIIQNGVTFGVEVETSSPTNIESIPGFNLTQDASVRTPYQYIDIYNGGLNSSTRIYVDSIPRKLQGLLSVGSSDMGIEFVSRVMDSTNLNDLALVDNLLYNFQSHGVVIPDKRSGIHFHFTFSNPNLPNLKNILRLGAFLESAFFLLGGTPGQEFRGQENDSIYCRPLTLYGPVVVERFDGEFSQCMNLEKLTDPKLKDLETFWKLFGDLPLTYPNASRYNPARYFWLNLFNCYQGGSYKGTVEFRVFNLTLNSYVVQYLIQLCGLVIRSALRTDYKTLKREKFLKINSVYTTSKDESLEALDRFIASFGETDEIFPEEGREEIMNIASKCIMPKLSKDLVYSHLRVNGRCPRGYWLNYKSLAEEVISDPVRNPEFIDIHQIRGERR